MRWYPRIFLKSFTLLAPQGGSKNCSCVGRALKQLVFLLARASSSARKARKFATRCKLSFAWLWWTSSCLLRSFSLRWQVPPLARHAYAPQGVNSLLPACDNPPPQGWHGFLAPASGKDTQMEGDTRMIWSRAPGALSSLSGCNFRYQVLFSDFVAKLLKYFVASNHANC